MGVTAVALVACATGRCGCRDLGPSPCLKTSMKASTLTRVSVRVEDESGAPIPGVTITAAYADGDPREGIAVATGATESDGTLAVQRVPGHRYATTAKLFGFRSETGVFCVVDACPVRLLV